MSVLHQLSPSSVWHYFEEICSIPRASKKEEKIGAYIKEFAIHHRLEHKSDKAGNILIRKAPVAGMENRQKVILQSHMDMVCEKNSSTVHNFDTDPIQPYIDGDWVKAKGTTLGADNGIGIASMLAVLADKEIVHGPIECLFTVDEETGLTGAQMLEPGFMNGKLLLNLDSEDEGELCIGCAGGIDTVAHFTPSSEPVPPQHKGFQINVSGLKGGHSGDDIDKGRANSLKLITRILWDGIQDYHIRVSGLQGGNLRNALPREATAVIAVPETNIKQFSDKVVFFTGIFQKEFNVREPDLTISIQSVDCPAKVFTMNFQSQIINSLYACPHGIQAMSWSISGLVETSTNLASVKISENNQITVATSQRSSVNSSKTDISRQVESVFILAGAEVHHSTGYPGWEPNPDSLVIQTAKSVYQELFNEAPRLRAIHAGLECGLFLEKYPELDMVSFGPTIRSPHSPDERVEIKSVEKYWDYLLAVLKAIPEV